jgi:hypothetical protein
VIQLTGKVKITGTYVAHVSPVLLHTAELISTPKEFSVRGLNSLDDKGQYCGQFSYDKNGNPILHNSGRSCNQFHSIELKIHTDHGNPMYSGLYRFIMHEGLQHHGEASAL